MKSTLAALTVFILTGSTTWAASDAKQYSQALELARAGNFEGAFLAYLTIPGAEHSAAALARTAPDKYHPLLETTNAPSPIIQLLEGDLLLAKGDRKNALVCYRAVAAGIATDYETGWDEDRVPWNYYFIEPLTPEQRLLEPFTIGSGAHSDNWLIRRFIALDALDDAEREFERIWKLHQHDSLPHIEMIGTYMPEIQEHAIYEPTLIEHLGYDNRSLRFALDYAYFLKRRGQEKKARSILSPVLLEMDLEKRSRASRTATKLSEDEAKKYPPRARDRVVRSYRYLMLSAGISHEEFIRLAFGEFTSAGKEAELEAALKEEIAKGNNRSRLVLARTRMHQQDIEGSLALELAYIRVADFDHASATYRRGIAYESHQKVEKAAEKYEALLAMKPTEIMNKPYVEKNTGQSLFGPVWLRKSSVPNACTLNEVIESLQRFYTASGNTDKSLNLSLARFDLLPACLVNLSMIMDAASRHAAAGKESEFTVWAADRADQEESLTVKANLYWAMNDPQLTLTALGEAENTKQLHAWKPRFKKEAAEQYAELLELSVAIDPVDSVTRLELLDLHPDPLGPDAIQSLEKILDPDAQPVFRYGKGSYNRTRFKNNHDLAYRLIRLYEQEKRTDNLLTLAERVALGQQPFPTLGSLKRDSYNFEKSEPYLLGILSRLIHYADFQTLEDLAEAWTELPDFPSKRQLDRKLRGGFATASAPPIPWANLPAGVNALASSENVLSLKADETYIYSGHPWGIAVYDHEGNPVVRVALGAAALTIETSGEFTWVGTPLGLWRIKPETWEVAHLRMDQDVPERDRKEDRVDFHNGTLSLEEDGDFLWIGTRRDIRRLDLKNGILRIFSQRELGVSSHNDWKHILVEENHVWFDGYDACLCYDRATESWVKLQHNQKTVHLIGDVAGELFGHINLGEPLRNRPCLINRETLEITPVLIQGNLTADQRCINGPFSYFGTYHDKPVLGPKYPKYVYDAESQKLTLIGAPWDRKDDPIESPIPSGLRSGTPKKNSDGSWTCYDDSTHRHTVFGKSFHTGNWSYLTLTNGVHVLGGSHADSPRYIYLSEDRPNSSYRKRQRAIHSGGLHFISTNGEPQRISSSLVANTIPSDLIYSVATEPENEQRWLCGDSGLTLLTHDNAVLENIQRADGLPASRIIHTTNYNDNTWFTCSTGDPIILDGSTVFRPFPKENTKSAVQNRLGPDEVLREPLLGGFVITTSRVDNATFICGTRGLLIYNGSVPPAPIYDTLMVEVKIDETKLLIEEAKAMKVEKNISRERLNELLNHDNPFVRAEALGSAAFSDAILQTLEFPSLVEPYLSDNEPRIRCTAVYALTRCNQDYTIIPILEDLLSSPDKRLRAIATVDLCRRGQLPDIKYLRAILKEGDSYGNHPFGAASTIGVEASRWSLLKPLAPLATPDIFALLLEEYPLSYIPNDTNSEFFPQLGASLLRHPEAADILLSAYDKKHSHSRRNFSMYVFQFSGTDMLKTLHAALKSNDRVVRSNAARACGAIGDSSSIPPLMVAWDLESGLSRASIVWALGELGATEAVPLLEQAYIDTRNEEKRVQNSGQRASQSRFGMSTQYDVLMNLEAVGAEWDELKAASAPKPIDPKTDEELITTRVVLEAFAKLDPAATEAFYRTLTADENQYARDAAAERLALAPDREQNRIILRCLLADEVVRVQITAAASLLILGDPHAESYFLKWLADEKQWIRVQALYQLTRVESPEALAFACERFQKIAASNPEGYERNRELKYAKELQHRLNPRKEQP